MGARLQGGQAAWGPGWWSLQRARERDGPRTRTRCVRCSRHGSLVMMLVVSTARVCGWGRRSMSRETGSTCSRCSRRGGLRVPPVVGAAGSLVVSTARVCGWGRRSEARETGSTCSRCMPALQPGLPVLVVVSAAGVVDRWHQA